MAGREGSEPDLQVNLGEQQRQQVREVTSQLVGNILDNQNNFSQLTTNPNGARRNIDEIEEIFLSGSLNQQPQSPTTPAPTQITNSLSFEVIEQTWYELRVFINAGLQNPNQPLIDNVRLRIRNDIEKWLKWELEKIKGDYNKLLEEHLKLIQGLKTIRELFEKYSQIRTNLVINKVDRSKELIGKGYSDIDVAQLKEWNLLDQEFPNLYDKKRIGVTNALSAISTITTDRRTGKVLSKKITGGSSRKLLLFLKPSKNHSSTVYFPPDKIEKAQQNSVRKVIKSLLENQSAKLERIQNYDIYILRVDSSHDGAGPSSGVAHYLALYSALNKVPLPSNLASTGTIKGTKVGAIGGLQHKLEASVENGIDIFILSHKNKKSTNQEESFDDTPHNVENKIKQVHFISQVDQIEIALNEILDNTVKEKVHICNKDKTPDEQPEKPEQREPPEKPEQPNSKITSEQLLSLITELNIREKGSLGEHQDFWEKLKETIVSEKSHNYEMAVWGGTKGSISLQKEYEEKIAELSKPRNPNQGKKNRKFSFASSGKIVKEEEVEESDKWTCKVCHQPFEEGYTVVGAEPSFTSKERWCSKCVPDTVKKGEIKITEEKIGGKEQNSPKPEEIEKRKKQIIQEYQTKFQEIASSVANLTIEILTNLQKNGYVIQKIEWTSELHAPSLTAEPAVKFSLVRKK